MVIEIAANHHHMFLSITEDGRIVYRTSKDFLIEKMPDGSVKGLTEASKKIIELHKINDPLDIQFRNNYRLIYDLTCDQAIHEKSVNFFNTSLDSIRSINRQSTNTSVSNLITKLLYANAFAVLEGLLSEYLINSVKDNEDVLYRLGSNYKGFEKDTYSLKHLVSQRVTAKDLVIEKLQAVIFHNLPLVSHLYQSAFSIEFPNFSKLMAALPHRHDIVHRNGIPIGDNIPRDHTPKDVMLLIIQIQEFVIELIKRILEKAQQK